MTIPERVRLTTPMTIGIHAIMGVCFTAISLNILYLLNISMQSLGFFALALVIIPTLFGAYLDRKALLRDKTEQLSLHGFQRCKSKDIDPALINAFLQMQPYTFKAKTIRRAFHSTRIDQEIYLTQHHFGDGEETIVFTACAIWTPLDLATASIRRRRLKDKFSFSSSNNHCELGEHHIIESKDEQLIQTISMMHPWFALTAAKPRNFRIHQPPGLKEQWAMSGHWVIYSDLGNADTKSMLKLTEFLGHFVKQLEANALPST